jgi:hypothetical protein
MATPAFNPGSARDLVKDGTWFRDAQGRFALFRGVNFGGRSKHPPYLPIMPLSIGTLDPNAFSTELAAAQPQLDLLKSLGMNVVRLPIMWKALEPTPNPNPGQLLPGGSQYLAFITSVIDELYRRGMFVFIDFHQDIAHEVYGGDGFPDWALAIDKNHPLPSPAGFTNKGWAALYVDNPAPDFIYNLDDLVQFTLQSFWNNNLTNINAGLTNFPVRTHLEKTIGATVRFFQAMNNGAGHPAILGYEAFNEPPPVDIDVKVFETQILPNYYSNVLREIQSAGDLKSFLLIEPRVDWTSAAPPFNPVSSLDTSGLGGGRVVFAFHYYDPWTIAYGIANQPDDMHNKQMQWPGIFQQLCQSAVARGLIPFMTEFGGSHDWQYSTDLPAYSTQIRAYMDLQFQLVEANLLNATYWHYDLYNTADNKDNWNLEDFSLLGPNRVPRELDIVARPYSMRSSAKPSLLCYDSSSRQGAIMLTGPVVNAPTVIYIPFALRYPDGFEVRTTSPNLEWDANAQLLYWYPDGGQAVNQLIICPAFGFNAGLLPPAVQNLLPNTPLRLAQPNQCQVVRVDPVSIALGTPVQVSVYVEDTVTHAPVTGTATIRNYSDTGQPTSSNFATSTPTNVVKSNPITFHSYEQPVQSPNVPGNGGGGGGGSGGHLFYPTGVVNASSYLSASIPFNFLDAAFNTQTVPSSMTAGQSYSVTVTMVNTGNRPWTPGGSNPLRLGAQNPQDNNIWGLSRVDVPSVVNSGASVTFSFTVTAPSTAGSYNFQWRMVQETVTWFGDMTSNVPVTVSKGKETKEKEGKAEKDFKDRKDRDAPLSFGPTGHPQQGEVAEPGTAQGQSFITAEERPAVGGQALAQAAEEQA